MSYKISKWVECDGQSITTTVEGPNPAVVAQLQERLEAPKFFSISPAPSIQPLKPVADAKGKQRK